jgi:hypothetical protein
MMGKIFQRSKVQLYIKGGIRHSHVVTLENFKFYTNKGVYVCLTDGALNSPFLFIQTHIYTIVTVTTGNKPVPQNNYIAARMRSR